jgi:predicted MFS family arabinose efflux permease
MRRRRAIGLTFLIAPGEYWVLVVQPSLPIVLVVLAAVGIGGGIINALTLTIRQERVRRGQPGRGFANFSAIVIATPPIGALLGGVCIPTLGLSSTLVVFAGAGTCLGAMLPFLPSIRLLDGDPSAGTRGVTPEGAGRQRPRAAAPQVGRDLNGTRK